MLNLKKLLIYYGWPNKINRADTTSYPLEHARSVFNQYDYVVLGAGLEKENHAAHADTADIIKSFESSSTQFFGYIDLGVKTNNFPVPEIQLRVDEWAGMGASGIFLDDAGYDFDVSRERINSVADYIHARGLPAVINAWNPDDIFSGKTDPVHNPAGKGCRIAKKDFFLCESYQVARGLIRKEKEWQNKVTRLMDFQKKYNFNLWAITTNSPDNLYDERKFFYSYYSALIYGFDASGWGEYNFSTDNNAPFRKRPAENIGEKLKGKITAEPPEYFRRTDRCVIRINAALGRYSLDF